METFMYSKFHLAVNFPLAHVIRHDDENGRQRGQRNEASQFSKEESNEKQCEGVHDSSDWSAASVLHVRGCACDRARCRHSAEHGSDDVRYTLRYQLHVGSVTAADHSVRHHR